MSRDQQCTILGNLRADFREDQYWAEFFRVNDVALPLPYGVELGYVGIVSGTDLERFLDETWTEFCEFATTHRDAERLTFGDDFRASSNPLLKGPSHVPSN